MQTPHNIDELLYPVLSAIIPALGSDVYPPESGDPTTKDPGSRFKPGDADCTLKPAEPARVALYRPPTTSMNYPTLYSTPSQLRQALAVPISPV